MNECDAIYTGWRRWSPTSDEWLALYNEGKVPFELKENQYLIVRMDNSSSLFYCYESGKLRKFTGGSIKTVREATPNDADEQKHAEGKKRKYAKGKSVIITPRNEEQVCAFDLMKDQSKTVKLLTGT